MSYSYFEAEGFERRSAVKASAQFSDARRPSWKWSSCRESRSSELPQRSWFLRYSYRVYLFSWDSPFLIHVLVFASEQFPSALDRESCTQRRWCSLFSQCWKLPRGSSSVRALNPTKIERFIFIFVCALIGLRQSWNLGLIREKDVEDEHSVGDGFYSLGSSEPAAAAPVLLLLNWLTGSCGAQLCPAVTAYSRCFVTNYVSTK